MALLIILLLPVFLFFLLQQYKTRKNIRLPPGPGGFPFNGNLHQLDISNRPRHFRKLSKQYGPFMSLSLGCVRTLVVSSAKLAKEILKTHDLELCSRPAMLGQQKLSYNGLDLAFAPYSDYWREMRKICVVHLFNFNRVQQFRPIREDEVSRMIEKIARSSAISSKPVNLSEIMMSMTSNIICRVAFGKKYQDDGSDQSRFYSLVKKIQIAFGGFYYSDHFPMMGWLDRFTGKICHLEKIFKELDEFYEELIEEHLDPKRPKIEQEDIIDVLLQILKDQKLKVDLTWDHIKAVLMNVFVAGADTSAVTVVWAMTYLMTNPRVMRKAQEEIRDVSRKKGFVDEDDVQKLPYLKAVVKETMRLQPTAPLLVPRETIKKCNIEGYEMPPKTRVYINAWEIGRDPEAWDDPDEFYPDRFDGSSIDWKGQNFELIPFGGGRRICPGMHLGMAAVELALANLLYSFEWKLPAGMTIDDLDFEPAPGIVMHKKNALCLMARNYIG